MNPSRADDHVVDELLLFDMAAVASDQLHPRPRQGDLENAGVGGIGQVRAHDLAQLRRQRQLGLAVDQQDIAEAAHGRVSRLSSAPATTSPG